MLEFEIENELVNKYPIIISIPHSGTIVPEDIKSKMNPEVILANQDWFLKDLYSFFKEMDVTVIKNNISRYVIDVNRDIKQMHKDESYNKSLVYTLNTWGKPIYNLDISDLDIEERIEKYYKPYHNKLEELIKNKLKCFDKIYLFDLHSFGKELKESIILGNKYNTTTTKEYLDDIKETFEQYDFKVSDNVPFPGGYITKHYKEIFKDQIQSIQIELKYSKYIENREYIEEEITKYDELKFIDTKEKLKNIFNRIIKEIEQKK